MASSALTTAASSANSTTQSATAKTQLGSDMQSFLTLLTTQLQNQDPMDPTDSSEFATQLAQFSQVEQQIATNAHLESLLSLQQSASLLSSTGLVGNTVEVSSSQIVLKDGATQGLRLPRLADAGGAQGGIVTITNSSGAVVYTEAVALGTEATSWSWNGKGTNGASLGRWPLHGRRQRLRRARHQHRHAGLWRRRQGELGGPQQRRRPARQYRRADRRAGGAAWPELIPR
ncbi:flagellar hook assembly protein FlgD [Pseudoroseomonas cervicalis]|uniref:flagellar hook assembly protein FlgD n=1 Tax=Teichococcus cervicalis TaxID=204525 RepID=UPI0035E78B5D